MNFIETTFNILYTLYTVVIWYLSLSNVRGTNHKQSHGILLHKQPIKVIIGKEKSIKVCKQIFLNNLWRLKKKDTEEDRTVSLTAENKKTKNHPPTSDQREPLVLPSLPVPHQLSLAWCESSSVPALSPVLHCRQPHHYHHCTTH